MNIVDPKKDSNWVLYVKEKIQQDGYALVENVLNDDFLNVTKEKMDLVRKLIHDEIGLERLKSAGELSGGVLRDPMYYDRHFFKLLEIPEVLSLVDNLISKTAILHLQNGLILPSFKTNTPSVFQNKFHADIRRTLNNSLMAINIMFPIDDYSKKNGGTKIVPGTHQQKTFPTQSFIEENEITVECSKGTMIVFDSTLLHAAGKNMSGKSRYAINHIYTPSYMKQQMDIVRHLGKEVILSQNPRTQQLLGWYTRVPTNLDEFYKSPEERLYRAEQG
jgi:ectoine hydroxylase-related dioxygenase (phytanoyl-CoA dioxygenase family)